jgi:hypothetical protein
VASLTQFGAYRRVVRTSPASHETSTISRAAECNVWGTPDITTCSESTLDITREPNGTDTDNPHVLDGFVPGGNSADADMCVAQYWGGAGYEGNGSKEDGHT